MREAFIIQDSIESMRQKQRKYKRKYYWHAIAILVLVLFVASSDQVKSLTEMITADSEFLTAPPSYLQIPEIGLGVAVKPMAWQIVSHRQGLTTEWEVPLTTVGWHTNSVHAGGVGNVILSGHHLQGEKVFETLALGWVEVGQEIYLTDTNGEKFLYKIMMVSEPILARRGTPADHKRSQSYITPTVDSQLTLITGWPYFSTTHRIFVIAELIERVDG